MEEITYAGVMHINGVMKLSGENLEGRESILYSRKKKKKDKKTKYVMVAVGPIWQNRQERDELRKELISLQAKKQGNKESSQTQVLTG